MVEGEVQVGPLQVASVAFVSLQFFWAACGLIEFWPLMLLLLPLFAMQLLGERVISGVIAGIRRLWTGRPAEVIPAPRQSAALWRLWLLPWGVAAVGGVLGWMQGGVA